MDNLIVVLVDDRQVSLICSSGGVLEANMLLLYIASSDRFNADIFFFCLFAISIWFKILVNKGGVDLIAIIGQ